jgi:hypothetical protein
MALKNSLTINLSSKDSKEVISYCKLNNIEDIDKFVSDCFKQGLNIEIYGLLDGDSRKTAVIQEKRVEVPVEVIKEVEKIVERIVEVPVEKLVEKTIEVPVEVIKYVDKEVIKEVLVPKIEYIRDESTNKELLLKIEELENQPPKIVEVIKEVEKVVEVEKIVYTSDESKLQMLQTTLQTIRKELLDKNNRIKELEKIINEFNSFVQNKPALYHKGSNINEKL